MCVIIRTHVHDIICYNYFFHLVHQQLKRLLGVGDNLPLPISVWLPRHGLPWICLRLGCSWLRARHGLPWICLHLGCSWLRARHDLPWICLHLGCSWLMDRVASHCRLFRFLITRLHVFEHRLDSLQLFLHHVASTCQHFEDLIARGPTLPSPSATAAAVSPKPCRCSLEELTALFRCRLVAILFLVVGVWVGVALPGPVTREWGEERGRILAFIPPSRRCLLTTITRESRPRSVAGLSPRSAPTSTVHGERVVSTIAGVGVSR